MAEAAATCSQSVPAVSATQVIMPFGPALFCLDIPFYYFALRRMGLRFTTKTCAAVALVSGMSMLHPLFVGYDHLQLFYVAILGGLLMGVDLVIMLNHRPGRYMGM